MPDFSLYAFDCGKFKSKDTPLFVWIQTRLFCLCLYFFWQQCSLNQCQSSLCAVTHRTGIRNHNAYLLTDASYIISTNCLMHIIVIHELPYARAKNMYDNRAKLYCLVKRMFTGSKNVEYNVISETCGLLERLMLQINVCLASLLSLLY